MIGDGLSAPAVVAQAAGVVRALVGCLPDLAARTVILVHGARVALGDAIGAATGAGMALIGERPGVSVADSRGAYLAYAPRIGLRDNARNCVLIIHPSGGLSHQAAAERQAWLVMQGRRIGATGIALKDESGGNDPLPPWG